MQVSSVTPTGGAGGHVADSPARATSSPILGRIMTVVKDHQSPLARKEEDIRKILDEAFLSLSSEEDVELTGAYISQLEAAQTKLTQTIETLTKQNKALTGSFEALHGKTKEIEHLHTDLSIKYKETERESLFLKERTTSLKTKHRDLKSKYQVLKATCTDLTDQNGSLAARTSSLEERCTTLEKTHHALKKEKEESKEEATKLKKDYTDLEGHYAALEGETRGLRATCEHLRQEYDKLQRHVNAVIADNARMQAEMEAQAKKAEMQMSAISVAWLSITDYLWSITVKPAGTLIQSGQLLVWTLKIKGESR